MDNRFSAPRRSLISRYFAFLERRSFADRLFFHTALIIFLGALLFIVTSISGNFMSDSPTKGGSLVEGIVGTPRFVNPVLALTRADRDATALIFSGLMKLDSNGEIVPDLAESVTISEDGRTYTVTLRNGAMFHDDAPVTASDVIFTISLLQNPDLKSPLRSNWDGVVATEIDTHQLTLTLSEAYTPFIENLTVGILPRHLWGDMNIEQLPFSYLNTDPIGTGPYHIASVSRDNSGLVDSYVLKATENDKLTPPISKIILRFFQTEEALSEAFSNNELSSTAQLPLQTLATVNTDKYQVVSSPLPRTFGLFINQNQAVSLRDIAVRTALETLIDRNQLVSSVLEGYGVPTDSPIPPGFTEVESISSSSDSLSNRTEQAITILEDADWKRNEAGEWVKDLDDNTVVLAVNISTANNDVFQRAAEYIALAWQEIGINVSIDQYEQSDLVQSIIRPRNFEVLLFGTDVNRYVDLYPFWHSSQREDPGLNITQYTNIETDTFLENARTATSTTERNKALQDFSQVLANEKPAIFLFSPTMSYVIETNVAVPPLKKITIPSERFSNIREWHINKDSLWPFFK